MLLILRPDTKCMFMLLVVVASVNSYQYCMYVFIYLCLFVVCGGHKGASWVGGGDFGWGFGRRVGG